MFLQEAPADTTGYMIAGYAIAFIVMALYVASLYIRNRNLQRDLTTLEEMDKAPAPPSPGRPKTQPKKTAKPVTKRVRKK